MNAAPVSPAVPAATVMIVREAATDPQVLLIRRPDRGSFPGAWVFPGGKVEPSDAGDDELARARSTAVRETHEETGLHLDPGALIPLALWDPPEHLPARFATWFFVTDDPGGELVLHPSEAEAAEWVRPADALAEHAREARTLVPPTFVMLQRLANLGADRPGAEDVPEHLITRLVSPGVLAWQGDEAWDPETPGALGGRHRLSMDSRPWHFERTPPGTPR